MSLDRAVERVLHRLSDAQVEALAATADGRDSPGGALGAAVVGAQPGAQAAVAELAERWAATPAMTGSGVALALRLCLQARSDADAHRSLPVWTGPGAVGEQRLTAGVLHELISSAQQRILLVSFAAHTLPSLATDLEKAVGRGCTVDVAFRVRGRQRRRLPEPPGPTVPLGTGHPPLALARRATGRHRSSPARQSTRGRRPAGPRG